MVVGNRNQQQQGVLEIEWLSVIRFTIDIVVNLSCAIFLQQFKLFHCHYEIQFNKRREGIWVDGDGNKMNKMEDYEI